MLHTKIVYVSSEFVSITKYYMNICLGFYLQITGWISHLKNYFKDFKITYCAWERKCPNMYPIKNTLTTVILYCVTQLKWSYKW